MSKIPTEIKEVLKRVALGRMKPSIAEIAIKRIICFAINNFEKSLFGHENQHQ